jgi:hypothetical protein
MVDEERIAPGASAQFEGGRLPQKHHLVVTSSDGNLTELLVLRFELWNVNTVDGKEAALAFNRIVPPGAPFRLVLKNAGPAEKGVRVSLLASPRE